MRKPPPPFRPLALSVVVERLRIVLPVTALALLVVLLTPGLALLLARPATMLQPEDPRVGSDAVSVRAPALAALGVTAFGELPPTRKGQALPPCHEAETELRGACWVPIDKKPCPKVAYIHDKGPDADGKCYVRALPGERPKTSGELQSSGIADP
jgi:hypothetical protein